LGKPEKCEKEGKDSITNLSLIEKKTSIPVKVPEEKEIVAKPVVQSQLTIKA